MASATFEIHIPFGNDSIYANNGLLVVFFQQIVSGAPSAPRSGTSSQEVEVSMEVEGSLWAHKLKHGYRGRRMLGKTGKNAGGDSGPCF